MGVYIQCETGGGMAEHILHTLHVRPAGNGNRGRRVPLWHNKDKPENPCGAGSWRLVLILFPLKTDLKWGLREGVINEGCT